MKEGAFSLLTTAPGAGPLAPYHDRQIVLLPPGRGVEWLELSRPVGDLLKAPLAGALRVTTLRRDGVEAGAQPSLFA